MKNTKRLLSLILSGVMLASSAAFTANAAKITPKYQVDFKYDVWNETATAEISVSGGTYGIGRFGFDYNEEALVLVNADGEAYNPENEFVADAVIGESNDDYTVMTTEETNFAADLIDIENGTVLFAWAVNGDKFIDSADEAKLVATVNFKLTEEYAAEENPKTALNKIKGKLIKLADDEIVEDLAGWKSLYEVVTEDYDIYEVADKNVKTSVAFVNEPTVTTTTTSVTVKWDENDLADKFEVTVTDEDGNVIHTETVEGNEIKLTKDEGLEKGEEYVITITPKDENGDALKAIEIPVKMEKTTTTPGGNSGTSSGDGASMTFTVTYVAGEGTIPEGQKFKYTVARNGYVSGSPAVIAPEGKVFAGWSVDGVTLISVEVYKITKDIAFKAIYVEREEDTHRPFILGYPGGEVRADNFLTRAEAATIIARASKTFDSNKTYTANFTDVPADHWAANYIAYVYESNIVTGYEDNTFHPSSNITRAEFATIMQRFLGIEFNEDALFTDVDKSHWAVAYIGACKAAGLINGYENGEFRPANSITRAEAVKILNRASDRIPTPTAIDAYVAEKGVPFEDLDAAKWYYYEIMEAAFPHLITYYH